MVQSAEEYDAERSRNQIIVGFLLAGVVVLATWAQIAGQKQDTSNTAQKAVIMKLALQEAQNSLLRPGQIINNRNCRGDICFQGTILSVPTAQQCGVIYLGLKGEAPSGVSMVPTGNKFAPWKEMPNPDMQALCVKPTEPGQVTSRSPDRHSKLER